MVTLEPAQVSLGTGPTQAMWHQSSTAEGPKPVDLGDSVEEGKPAVFTFHILKKFSPS